MPINSYIKEVESIDFGLYSEDEIKNFSVAEITSTKLSGGIGSVYDERMGTLENGVLCETCKQGPKKCPGHFGYIKLNEPIIHPMFYKEVKETLSCFCIKCCRLLITKEQIMINKYSKSKTNKILKEKKVDECCHCGHSQPDFKHVPTDNNIYMIYKQKGGEKVSIILGVEEIKNIFDRIINQDLDLIGINYNLVHPKNFIMTLFPVIPHVSRPYVIADGNYCDDDLTNQIIEIIKSNNHLSKDSDMSESKKQKYLQSLKFRILTFYNNSSSKARHSTSGRPIKGIKERLTGKSGQLRSALLGKRCDQTARTVIGPDPNLKMGQLGMPQEMANILTIPVMINNLNIDYMTNLVNNGGANYVIKNNKTKINLSYALNKKGTSLVYGDEIHRDSKIITYNYNKNISLKIGDMIKRDGKFLDNIEYPYKKTYKLEIGDIVERKLQDGDIVLLNRQPTLHAGSMMAQEIVIKPYKTLRFNLSINKSFNADFDGDEIDM